MHPDDMLEVDKRSFVATGNPMFAWSAYRLARLNGVAIPEWVLRYLDYVGRGLMDLSVEAHESASAKGLGPRIAKTMGLASDGQGSPLRRFHSDWMVHGMEVRARMTQRDENDRGDLETYAIEDVADRRGVDRSTVRRAFKLYDELFPGDTVFPHEVVVGGKSETK